MYPINFKGYPSFINSLALSYFHQIMHIVRGIRAGRITVEKPTKKPKHYDLWSADGQELAGPMYMPAPKMKLPGNEESYNPPSEYLFTDQEKEQWENTDPSDRKIKLVPQKYVAIVFLFQILLTNKSTNQPPDSQPSAPSRASPASSTSASKDV